MAKTNGQLLRLAAGVMKKRGHGKMYLELPGRVDGPVCLQGAINVALTGDACKWPTRATRLQNIVGRYLSKKFKTPTAPIEWNNRHETTSAEVIAALRGAARMADQRSRS